MLENDSEKYLQEILQGIKEEKVVLFLGAGASHTAGGPTGKKLTEMIKEKFPNINQSLDDFIEVCQDVIDTPPYNRIDLEEFIKSKLRPLQPTTAHTIMTKYNWASIFTTNFDDLIELSYRTTPNSKPCLPIYSERFQVTPSDRSKICLFKIMGSTNAIEGESGQMVLSRRDYNRALIRRKKYLELLSDFIKNGTVIFIGYGFGDRIVLDIMDEVIEIYTKERIPWSYALFDKLQMDDKLHHMFSSRKIIPLEINFQDFFNYLKGNYGNPHGKTTNNVHLRLKGYTLEINDDEYRQYEEYFDILSDEKINQDSGKKDDFFMGINKSWGVFNEDWDFKRDIYKTPEYKRTIGDRVITGNIKDRIFNELRKFDIENNKVILVKGMAGAGKTIMLSRLAYDIHKSGEAPVIIIKSEQSNFDYRLLSTFIENLNKQYNQKIPEGKSVPPLKPVIIIDDAASLIRHVNSLKDYLSSRGRPAIIIAAERNSEWETMWSLFPFKIHENNVYELEENLSDQEKSEVIEHFYRLGYVHTKGTFLEDIINKEYENSFFATIYSLVHPSRKPLNWIIQNQYQNLSEMTKKAFRYICCFHQFNLPINIELLVRALGCSYNDFIKEVIEKDALKVIFEVHDEIGNILYRTHHRIIAKKTIEYFFNDPEILKNYFIEILKECNLANSKEREICEKLLITYIGPNAKPQVFTYGQQRQIFRIVCEKNPIRKLIHHWGVLEIDDVNYSEAERLLKSALDLPREDIESYRGESDQAILTSLGNLYSHRGMEFLKEEPATRATEYFAKAEACFRDAKRGGYPGAHPYGAHALMWFLRGKKSRNESESLNYYARALEILAIAKDNLNEDDLQAIYELETQLWEKIGDETKINQNMEILRDKFNSVRGYYLYAELLWRRAHDCEKDERRRLSELALRKIEKGIKFFPDDESCIRLRSKLIKELYPDDVTMYYESLNKWKFVVTVPNAWLLYELGRTSFILGYYDYAKEYFKELETGVGIGHRLRSRSRHPIKDETENIKVFEGVIVNIFSPYEGEIRCETLRNLRYPLPFRPIACGFTPSRGDFVKFNIEFTFRSPVAVNVKKI